MTRPSKTLGVDDGGDGVPVHLLETRADQDLLDQQP